MKSRFDRAMGPLCVLLVWLVAFPSPAVAGKAPQFHWSRRVELPSLERPTLMAIQLDSQIFAAQSHMAADFRLRDKDGAAVAFIVRKALATKERAVKLNWTAISRGAKPLESGGLEILLDNDERSPAPQGLSIVTPLTNFEHQVQVFRSADGTAWERAGPAVVIFDYSRFVDVRNVAVPFEAGGRRHFRVVIDDVTAEQASRLLELTRHLSGPDEVERSERVTIDRRPFRVDAIDFFRHEVETVTSGEQTIVYPIRDLTVGAEKDNGNDTLIRFSTNHEPVTSFKLLTDSTNFNRAVKLRELVKSAKAGGKEWVTIANATVTKFTFEGIRKEELTIAFSEQFGDQYQIVVNNRDSPPLMISGVVAEGPLYELVFLGEPGQSLTLDYGPATATGLTYDTAAVQKLISAGYAPTLVSLADPVENAVELARPGFWEWINDSRGVVAVIACLTAILGWGLYRASRRLDSLPPV